MLLKKQDFGLIKSFKNSYIDLLKQYYYIGGMPLKAYQDFHAFKLFFLDIGLLGALSDLDAASILAGNTIFEEFKGALTEQFVLQQLIAENNIVPFYWSAEKGRAEIDFIIQKDDKILPIEAKATENLQAKSLKAYCQKYNPVLAIRSSLSDYRVESWLTNVPLYALSMFLK